MVKVGERKKATSAAKGRREDEALANDEVSCQYLCLIRCTCM